jgi:transposase InsO family protein
MELHEAHPGVSRMKALARSYVWWPTLDQDIEREVKNSHQCQLHHATQQLGALHPWEWPGHPWTRLFIDYVGPFKGEMFLVVIDAYSKWLKVHQMTSTTSTATIEKLREIFATHRIPKTVVSDNGTNFTSSEFEEFMK